MKYITAFLVGAFVGALTMATFIVSMVADAYREV